MYAQQNTLLQDLQTKRNHSSDSLSGRITDIISRLKPIGANNAQPSTTKLQKVDQRELDRLKLENRRITKFTEDFVASEIRRRVGEYSSAEKGFLKNQEMDKVLGGEIEVKRELMRMFEDEMRRKRLKLDGKDRRRLENEIKTIGEEMERERGFVMHCKGKEEDFNRRKNFIVEQGAKEIKEMEDLILVAQEKRLSQLEERIRNDKNAKMVDFEGQLRGLETEHVYLGVVGEGQGGTNDYENLREEAVMRDKYQEIKSLETQLEDIHKKMGGDYLDTLALDAYKKRLFGSGTNYIDIYHAPDAHQFAGDAYETTPTGQILKKKAFIDSQEFYSPKNNRQASYPPQQSLSHPNKYLAPTQKKIYKPFTTALNYDDNYGMTVNPDDSDAFYRLQTKKLEHENAGLKAN
jgi:hypothetical protein